MARVTEKEFTAKMSNGAKIHRNVETNHSFEERVLMIQKEVKNGPRHTFGDHTVCNISEHFFVLKNL